MHNNYGSLFIVDPSGIPLQLHAPATSFPTCTSVTLQWATPDNRGNEIDVYTIRYRPYVRYPLDTQLPWITMLVTVKVHYLYYEHHRCCSATSILGAYGKICLLIVSVTCIIMYNQVTLHNTAMLLQIFLCVSTCVGRP